MSTIATCKGGVLEGLQRYFAATKEGVPEVLRTSWPGLRPQKPGLSLKEPDIEFSGDEYQAPPQPRSLALKPSLKAMKITKIHTATIVRWHGQ
ncbi:unnamed protein product [Calypogeia fissa]